MKVFKIESERDLQPEDLVKLLLGAPDNILPDETEIETEWKLIQSKPGDAEGEQEDADVKEDPLDHGKHSVVRRYEFYRYTGPRDPENNEALPCIADDTPVPADAPVEGCSDLGEFVGAQNVAVDVDLTITDSALPTGEVGLAYPAVALVIGGLPPYAITVGANPVPDGLSLDLNTGVLSGKPTSAGHFSFTIDGEDAATDVVHGAFDIDIAPPVVIETNTLLPAVVGECYSAMVTATGGVEPYAWAEIRHDLPNWASTQNNNDISGCPERGDEDVSPIAFVVTDALGGTSSKTLDLTVVGGVPTATGTPIDTPTPTITATASPSATPGACVGDCGSDGAVAINELIRLVNIALAIQPPSACASLNPDVPVDIAFLIRAVGNSLNGCASL
jgi:hypothetical protein